MTRFEVVRQAILVERSPLESLLGTAIAISLPTGLRLVLGASADPVPFVTYFPFVLLSAIFLGWRWAALGTVISALIVNFAFLPHPLLDGEAGEGLAIFIYFGLSCALLIVTGDTLRRVTRQMARLTEERNLLLREMAHRVQNTLAVVNSLVRMDRGDKDLETFKADLLGRFQALADANRVLRDGTDDGYSVQDLVERAILPFGYPGTIDAQGADHALDAESAHHLLLILHELCTNAVKHGALKSTAGRVEIRWQASAHGFELTWREHGVPGIVPPSRSGLGTRLLQSQPAFRVETAFLADGLHARVWQIIDQPEAV